MDAFTVAIAPGNSVRDSGMAVAAAKAGFDGDTIVAESILDPINGVHAALFAVRRKADGAVFARLSEWTLAGRDSVHITFRDEPEAFPSYRLATLEVLSALSPTIDHESLIWRDRSRWTLAEAGLLRAPDLINQPAASADAPLVPAAEATFKRAHDIPVPQNPTAQTDVAHRDPEAPARTETKRLRLLVDRAPHCKVASSTGAQYLNLSGYARDGARGFIRMVAFGPVAQKLADRLAEVVEAHGTAALTVEGRFSDRRQFKIAAFVSVEPTAERIPQRQNSTTPVEPATATTPAQEPSL